MKIKTRLLSFFAISVICCSSVLKADQASNLKVVGVPTTAKVNTTVSLAGVLQDAWDNAPLSGRSVEIEVGERYYTSSTPFNTGANGGFSQTWRFNKVGRHRVSFHFKGDGNFKDSRITVFVNVTQ
jgi:hypothetical protein